MGHERYLAKRAQNQRLNVRSLPEEPLRNACVGDLSVAMNMGLRRFDQAPVARLGWMRGRLLRDKARDLIAAYKVKTQGENAPIRSLSGGNVQRAVLARELGIPYAAINVVANYAAGRAGSANGICFDSIETVLHEAMGRVRKVLDHLCTA